MYKAKILANLKVHGYKWVNYFITMNGLEDVDTGNALKELIHEHKVETQMVKLGNDKFNRPITAPLYRLTPDYSGRVIGNNSHLSVVK